MGWFPLSVVIHEKLGREKKHEILLAKSSFSIKDIIYAHK